MLAFRGNDGRRNGSVRCGQLDVLPVSKVYTI